MSLKDEIREQVGKYMTSKYEVADANVVPDKQSIGFGAQAKKLWARVIFIDLRNSKELLVDNSHLVAARTHKSFLYAASKCIRAEGGDLRGFNGDSVLAFFAGKDDEVAVKAVRAAMKTKYAVQEIINPLLRNSVGKELNFGIGIDQGEIFVVKSGVPGEEINQDLLWIGWPTYHAFEYGNKARSPKSIWISKNVYNSIKSNNDLIYSSDGQNMWVYADESLPNGTFRVYKTNYRWKI